MAGDDQKFEDRVETWDAFMRHPHVRGAQEKGAPWVVFRGQTDAKHGLSPSLSRAVSVHRDPTVKTLLKYEEACREEFETQAHLYPFAALPNARRSGGIRAIRTRPNEGHESDLVRLVHLFERPPHARIARQSPATIG